MGETSGEPVVNVVIAVDFSDDIMRQLREVSPRLHLERHFPTVPDRVWADAEVLYTGSQFPQPEQAPHLRWVQVHSAGIDRLTDHPLIKVNDVEITTASGIHSVQIAEFCLGMMLAFNLRIPTMLALQREAKWNQEAFAPRIELRGQTVGIVGYGSIGRELARICSELGMTVLAAKRNLMDLEDDGYIEPGTGDPDGSIPDRLYPSEALASMARECDFLVVTTPLTESTRNSINEAVISAMKSTAVLINIGRGGVVDEKALIHALERKQIKGAGLDVFAQEPLPPDSRLWTLDNVILSPHVSGDSVHYHQKAAALFRENLQRYLEKQPLLNAVNREHGY